MAQQQPIVVVPQVHTVAPTPLPHPALGTLPLSSPVAVAELAETVGPHVPEVIAVDVALVVGGTNARTTRYGAIDAYPRHRHPRRAVVKVVANLGLVPSQKALAGIIQLERKTPSI